jgi:hypothetical protein
MPLPNQQKFLMPAIWNQKFLLIGKAQNQVELGPLKEGDAAGSPMTTQLWLRVLDQPI